MTERWTKVNEFLQDVFFVTGNRFKLAEVEAVLGKMRHIDLDLPEVQELDSQGCYRQGAGGITAGLFARSYRRYLPSFAFYERSSGATREVVFKSNRWGRCVPARSCQE